MRQAILLPLASRLSIQSIRVILQAARTEDANAAMSEPAEAVFPVESEQAGQGHLSILSHQKLIDSGCILGAIHPNNFPATPTPTYA
jgi:hypothetical protein